MRSEICKLLDTGDSFPLLEFPVVSGGTFYLPKDFNEHWNVFLIYRGHWWPYCRQQLLDFQRNIDEFGKKDIRIIAASSDSEEDAAKTVDKYGLTFSVGYGLIASEVSAITGSFFHAEKKFLHASGFIISPGGKIENAVFSSGAIGRLVAKDCLAFIEYLKKL